MSDRTKSADSFFERLADLMSYSIGRPGAFLLAILIVAVWAATGPFAGFSNTWQLIINTGTTIITFLMIFLLGNASNRITDSQDEMLKNIYTEERRLDAEEQLIKRVLDRIDVRHIRPILSHLDQQDHQIEELERRILAAISASHQDKGAAQP